MFRSHGDINRTAAVATKCVHSSENPVVYNCQLCDEGWQSESEVFLHMEAHMRQIRSMIKEDRYVCSVCLTVLPTAEHLMKHFKSTHLLSSEDAKRVERQIFICNDCSQIFFNKTMLTGHIFMKHPFDSERKKILPHRTDRIQCPRCNKCLLPKRIWYHLLLHGALSVSSCRICFVKFKNRAELKQHYLSKHAPYYFCDQCCIHAKNGAEFKRHIELHEHLTSTFKMKTKKQKATKKDLKERLKKWRYPKLLMFKGLLLNGLLNVCVLCRHICVTELERRQHLLSHYKVLKEKEDVQRVSTYSCSCGATFTSNILRKHHQLVEDHKEETKPTMKVDIEIKMESQENDTMDSTPQQLDAIFNARTLRRVFV